MIAQVIPIRRLPRQMGMFDYAVPSELEKDIQPGQLITIPMRKSTIYGLVFSCKEHSTLELKEVESIVHVTPLFSKLRLTLLVRLSKFYGVSYGTIAKMMMPPLQKRKLKKTVFAESQITNPKLPAALPSYIHYHNEVEHTESIQQKINETTLILVPEKRHIPNVLNLLNKEQLKSTLQWHSSLSEKEQFEAWFAIRNNKRHIVVGTRGAVFLPFQKLDTVIVDFEHHDQHKHWDQAPRFHVRDAANMLSVLYGSSQVHMSFTPSEQSYFAVHKKEMTSELEHFDWRKNISPIIADMKKERHGKNFSPLSFAAEDELLHTEGDVFLYLNRKGYATSVGCKECDHIEVCENCDLPYVYYAKKKMMMCHYCKRTESLPLVCKKCSSAIVQLSGAGIEKVEEYVRSLDITTHDIVSVHSDAEIPEKTDKPRIIIGTDTALQYVNWKKNKLTVFVNIDPQLFRPEYTAAEQVWHMIQEIIYSQPEGKFVVQTRHPDHLLFRSLQEEDRFYRTDLNLRRALLYPPYSYIVRYFVGHHHAGILRNEVMRTYKTVSDALTSEKKKLKLMNPIEMQPRYYRGKFWYTMVVKSDPKLYKENILWLNKHIPPSWRVDPRPNSLLSP
jgi:primosomal protein N' (replication factor Y) (superfamily II helicase)